MSTPSPHPTPTSAARRRFVELAGPAGSEPPLIETALVIASEEYPDLNVRNYLARLFAFRSVISDRFQALAGRHLDQVPVDERIEMLNHYLYDELKFHGDQDTYEDPDNSYLNQVIERRSGIPITLSMIYLEVAAGARLRLAGVGFPGHFLVKTWGERPVRVLDPFAGGRALRLEDLRDQLHAYGFEGKSWIRGMRRTPNRAILQRLLGNLKMAYVKRGDYARALAAVDRILILDPNANEELRDQGTLSGQIGEYRRGIAALRAYLRAVPDASDRETVEAQLESFRYWHSRRN